MDKCHELEAMVVRNLTMRGLTRVPNRLAFMHEREVVELTIEQSVYTGYFVVVLDAHRKPRHFRARAGDHDWNAIAACVVETAEGRPAAKGAKSSTTSVRQQNERLARDLATFIRAGSGSSVAIEPSSQAPGRVRVKLPEVDLDPITVMRLFEVVREALPERTDGASSEPTPVL